MKGSLVSIIVPIYNVDQYLSECLDSIVKQTYTNLEIILVDDGSTDQCYEIAHGYEIRDSRIILLRKENGGAASAKNLGLNTAKGKYVALVDSDDYLDEKYIEILVNAIEQNDAEIAVCSYYECYVDQKYEHKVSNSLTKYTEKQYLEHFLNEWTCGIAWNKIFKKNLLKNVRYEEGHKIDDEFFTYKAVLNSKNIVEIPVSLYYYRIRKTGIMRSSTREHIIKDKIDYLSSRYEIISAQYPDLGMKYLENLVDNFILLKRQCEDYPLLYSKINKIENGYARKIIFSRINFKVKLAFIKERFIHKYVNNSVEGSLEGRYFE